MPRLPRILLSLTVAFAALPAGEASAQFKDIRDWFVACDNGRVCSAFALTDAALGSYLRIDRDAAPDAPPRVTLVVAAENGKPFEMAFDDPAATGLPKGPFTATAEDQIKIEIKEPAAVESVLAALRKASKIRIAYTDAANKKPDERVIAEISLSGAAGAMLWIDEQQRRLDTKTALVRRGDKPASAVPAPPSLPVVKGAQPGKGALPKKFPAAVLAKAKTACGKDEDPGEPSEANRLSGNTVLYWFSCRSISGAYNMASAIMIAPADKPDAARLVQLPYPSSPASPDESDMHIVVNGGLDEKTLTLSMFNKGRGIGDCGSAAEWVWDGAAFRLTRYDVMSKCGGVSLEDWPAIYRATRKD